MGVTRGGLLHCVASLLIAVLTDINIDGVRNLFAVTTASFPD